MNNLNLNPKTETTKITQFISSTLERNRFNTAIVAVSGGLDSALVAYLTSLAISPQNTHLVHLPTQKPDPDWPLVTKFCRTPTSNTHTIRLKPILNRYQTTLTQIGSSPNQLRLGNLTARTRMTLLYDLAKQLNALVVGTENKSEHLLGYYTRYGDEASDLEPIRHLYKTQIIQLASHLKLPQPIIAKPPSAGLWPDQTDQQELGFSYSEADPILHLYHDRKLAASAIIKQGHSKTLVTQVINRVTSQQFKHQAPYHL